MCGEWAGCLTGEPLPERSVTTRAKTSSFNMLEESYKCVKVMKFAFFILFTFLTVTCEGKLRELLDKAAKRTHTQSPTFMTGEREIKKEILIDKSANMTASPSF